MIKLSPVLRRCVLAKIDPNPALKHPVKSAQNIFGQFFRHWFSAELHQPHTKKPRKLKFRRHMTKEPKGIFYQKWDFCQSKEECLLKKLRQDPLDLSFWSFLTFLHNGIEEVERPLLWKFYKKNSNEKLVKCATEVARLHKVSTQIGTQNRPSPKVQSLPRNWI